MSCSNRGDSRGKAATSSASFQIVQSLTHWVERMPFAFSLFVITEIFVDTFIICRIQRIGNVMYLTYVKKLFIGRNMNHEKSFRKRIPLHRRTYTQSLAHKKERVVLSYQKKVRRCLSSQFLVRLCFMPY